MIFIEKTVHKTHHSNFFEVVEDKRPPISNSNEMTIFTSILPGEQGVRAKLLLKGSALGVPNLFTLCVPQY